MLERQNRELKRRTRVASLFPNEASLLRLVTAFLVELSDEWETGMRYLTFQNLTETEWTSLQKGGCSIENCLPNQQVWGNTWATRPRVRKELAYGHDL